MLFEKLLLMEQYILFIKSFFRNTNKTNILYYKTKQIPVNDFKLDYITNEIV